MPTKFNQSSRGSQRISHVLSSQVLEFGGQMWKHGQPGTPSEGKRQQTMNYEVLI